MFLNMSNDSHGNYCQNHRLKIQMVKCLCLNIKGNTVYITYMIGPPLVAGFKWYLGVVYLSSGSL